MKTLITIFISMMLVMSFSISAESNNAMGGCQDDHMMGMMDDPESHSAMMDEIAADPEMRHQMMQKMVQTNSVDMHQMMNDPETREQMKMHVEMMQAMMDSEGMDPVKMKEMMENPEMMEMMKMHMMSVQMMGGMNGSHSEESGMDHSH